MGTHSETQATPAPRRRQPRLPADRCGLAELSARSGQRLSRVHKLLDAGLIARYSDPKNRHRLGVVKRTEAEVLIPLMSSELMTIALAKVVKADPAAVLTFAQDLARVAQMALDEAAGLDVEHLAADDDAPVAA